MSTRPGSRGSDTARLAVWLALAAAPALAQYNVGGFLQEEAGAQLEFVTGASSPNPPDPDPYGSTNANVTHTYTLRNGGAATTSAITLALSGGDASKWQIESPTGGDCVSGTTTLAPSNTCTVRVTFLAGQFGQTAGSYSASLGASATTGGSDSNAISGTAAYTWSASQGYTIASGSSGSSAPSGSCTTKGGVFNRGVEFSASGTQFERFDSGVQAHCSSGQNRYDTDSNMRIRVCNGSNTYNSNLGGSCCWSTAAGASNYGTCISGHGSCDASSPWVVEYYNCQ